MSMRGTITSRTMVSPNSMTEWMKLRSSDSIASSSWATSAMASTSDSVTRDVRPVGPNQPITVSAIDNRKLRDPLDRPELQDPAHDRRGGQRRRVGVLHRVVLRDRLEDDEDDDHFADGGDEEPGGAEEPAGEHADHRRRDQLADQHQQQDRVEELLRRLRELDERLRAVATLVAQRARPRLVHAHERRLGDGEEPREDQQHRDGDDQVGVARPRYASAARRSRRRPSCSGAPTTRARAPPSAPPRRPRRGPSRAGAARRARRAAPARRRARTSCSTALRAATAGQITMSPTSCGISGSGGSPGPLPPASGTRPEGSGSLSIGKLRTSVGPSLPMNCWLRAAIAGSSRKINETSARPRTPSSVRAPLASATQAFEVDRLVVLLVGSVDVDAHDVCWS